MDLPESASVTTCYLAVQSLSTSTSAWILRPPPIAREVTQPDVTAILWVANSVRSDSL